MLKSRLTLSLLTAASFSASTLAPPDCNQLAATRVVKIGGQIQVFLEKLAVSLKDGFSCHLIFPVSGTVKAIGLDNSEPKTSEMVHFCFDIGKGSAEVTRRVTVSSPEGDKQFWDYSSTADRDDALVEAAACRKRFYPGFDL